MDSETYLLELARYVILNPVRAGMVDSPADYPWSSYRDFAGLSNGYPCVWMRTILDRFHPTNRIAASTSYREFVAAGIGGTQSPWENLVAQLYLGGADFIARVEELVRNREWNDSDSREQQSVRSFGVEEVRGVIESQFRVRLAPKSWKNERARFAFALLARDEAISSLAASGTVLQLSSAAVHRLLGRAGHAGQR